MLKRVTVTGSTLRIRDNAYKQQLAESVVKHVWPMIAAGKFKPLISRTFPLAQAEEAHAAMEAADHAGKIILTVD
jgi:NADPH:quinone reductase-like Zn-dependent oxidoreductase